MHKNQPPAAFIAYFSFGIEKLHTAQCKESYAACSLCHAYRKMLQASFTACFGIPKFDYNMLIHLSNSIDKLFRIFPSETRVCN